MMYTALATNAAAPSRARLATVVMFVSWSTRLVITIFKFHHGHYRETA